MIVSRCDRPEEAPRSLFSEHLRLPRVRHQPARDRAAHLLLQQPHGACPTCTGLGSQMEFDPDLIVPDPDQEPGRRRHQPWDRETRSDDYYQLCWKAAASLQHPHATPRWRAEQAAEWRSSSTGRRGDRSSCATHATRGTMRTYETTYEGVIPNLQRRYRETTSDYIRSEIERYMTSRPCPTCRANACAPRRWPSPSPASTSTRSPSLSVRWARPWPGSPVADGYARTGANASIGPKQVPPLAERENGPSPARSSRRSWPACASWWTSAWTT
jgi:excinuclease UvrABC ATPase subunit